LVGEGRERLEDRVEIGGVIVRHDVLLGREKDVCMEVRK
jgi:hypothetical protein